MKVVDRTRCLSVLILVIVFWGAVIYIIGHFVSKWW